MILPEGEPFFFSGGRVGCLLIHGFLSAPQEMRWLGGQLSTAGFTVLGIRLHGHASHARDLRRAQWRDWLASVEDGANFLRDQCDQIIYMGMSLGGAIALMAAGSLPSNGVVAISTPFHLIPYRQLRFLQHLLPVFRPFSGLLRYLPKLPAWDYVDQESAKDHLTYPVFPTQSLAQIDRLFVQMRKILPKLEGPIMLIHAQRDRGVPIHNLYEISENIHSTGLELMEVENSGHVILLEPERERVAEKIIDFVAGIT
jgi:carboxylesterase